MASLSIKKEDSIKAALIDWLIERDEINDNAVLINELPIANFSRRVDLAVANGKLHAYEIKSDSDSLARLEGQISTYRLYFDKVTLVCAPKFTEKALSILPMDIEILEIKKNNSGVTNTFIKKRRGRTCKISEDRFIFSFVEKKEIVKFVRKNGYTCHPSEMRENIYNLTKNISIEKKRNFTINYLKIKYKISFENFINNKNSSSTSAENISLLSNNKIKRNLNKVNKDEKLKHIDISVYQKPINSHAIDISKNLSLIGIKSHTPIYIIPRKKIAS
ncbi:sce7726 family protein [Photorhabdus heterorhabditis]|uniref:Sce7726 family protein n=1 Tax=Photorhabdus heterorhabditis TaxID=880156 RepID=A0A5B0WQ32_9GAMM|nr:sce7726 family protein [Photorhabdus heterorhabditis]KAA1188578.1 sce7726 family protein [Photorhabdus heterorhabditis]